MHALVSSNGDVVRVRQAIDCGYPSHVEEVEDDPDWRAPEANVLKIRTVQSLQTYRFADLSGQQPVSPHDGNEQRERQGVWQCYEFSKWPNG